MNPERRILFLLMVLPFLLALLVPYLLKGWFFAHSIEIFYYLLVAFLMSFGLMPLMYKLGMILGITSKPGGRHPHEDLTPRTGGIAIFITFIATLNLVADPPPEFQALFWASGLIAVVGIIDDIDGLPAILKLVVQFVATVILVQGGIHISFIPDVTFVKILSTVVTFLWIIGITNAFNFLDGLDGLASCLAITICFFFIVISMTIANQFMVIASAILLGSIGGFIPYNFRYKKRAIIFLGDGGSTFIGFNLAALAILGEWGTTKAVDLAIPILLLIIPITDTVITNLLRIARKKVTNFRELLSYAGTDHLHHRLKKIGLRPTAVVLIICLVTIIMGLISMLLKRGDLFESLLALAIALIFIFLLISFLMMQEKRGYR